MVSNPCLGTQLCGSAKVQDHPPADQLCEGELADREFAGRQRQQAAAALAAAQLARRRKLGNLSWHMMVRG